MAIEPAAPSAGPRAGGPSLDPGASIRVALLWVAGIACLMIGALGLARAFNLIDLAAIARAAAEVDRATLALAVLLACANFVLRGLRWHLFTREISDNVTVRQSLVYYFAGFAFLLTPAKIGEVIRLWLLKTRHDVPYTRSLSLLVLDRAVDMACLVVFAGIGLMGRSESPGPLLAFLGGLAAVTALLSSRRIVVGCISLLHLASGRRWPGLMGGALRTYRSFRRVSRPHVLAGGMALGMLAWGAQIAAAWLIFSAIGFPLDLLTSCYVYAFTILVGIVPLFPGGVGGAEAAMVGLLVLAGMPSAIALTATMLIRIITLWLAVAVGLVTAPFALVRPRAAGVPAGAPALAVPR